VLCIDNEALHIIYSGILRLTTRTCGRVNRFPQLAVNLMPFPRLHFFI
jgi:hypothetical protein